MKNTFGESLSVTLFGESHGSETGAVLDGITPGIEVDHDYIAQKLAKRRGVSDISTQRRERDEFRIISGVYEGRTTGTPLTIIIPNSDVNSADYAKTRNLARPGHADHTAGCKYHGFEDPRGGGHFSGRLTCALTAAGAIVQHALEKRGILIGTHILRCADISDREFLNHGEDIKSLGDILVPVLDETKILPMKQAISDAKTEGDSIGGVLQTAVTGIPAGVGEPWFDSMEGVLAHALFSIPAVKGVEFGAGFEFAKMRGSQANDALRMENGEVRTVTNHSGGINGGITNGMPIVFQCAFRPTPSIAKTQKTIDMIQKTDAEITISGRHDPAIFPRAAAVVDSVTAISVADMLLLRFGTDYLRV